MTDIARRVSYTCSGTTATHTAVTRDWHACCMYICKTLPPPSNLPVCHTSGNQLTSSSSSSSFISKTLLNSAVVVLLNKINERHNNVQHTNWGKEKKSKAAAAHKLNAIDLSKTIIYHIIHELHAVKPKPKLVSQVTNLSSITSFNVPFVEPSVSSPWQSSAAIS